MKVNMGLEKKELEEYFNSLKEKKELSKINEKISNFLNDDINFENNNKNLYAFLKDKSIDIKKKEHIINEVLEETSAKLSIDFPNKSHFEKEVLSEAFKNSLNEYIKENNIIFEQFKDYDRELKDTDFNENRKIWKNKNRV